MADLPPEFLQKLAAVTSKRAKVVINHILAQGYITTAELKEIYGYDHPPRAARDVRELGIPLETYYIQLADGRRIAAYKFGDPSELRELGGRRQFSKEFKGKLVEFLSARCAITGETLPESELQIDHRIPYEVQGDALAERDIADYMLLSPSANRQKSWACEHCENGRRLKEVGICRACFWAYPEQHTHVAMVEVRRLELVWKGAVEVAVYQQLVTNAQKAQMPLQDYIKQTLQKKLDEQDW